MIKKRPGKLYNIISRILLTSVLLFSAETVFAFSNPAENNAPWQILADSLEYDKATGIYKAEGNVVITKGESRITSDFLEYSSSDNLAFARGHVVVLSKDEEATAERFLFNADTETGTMYNGRIFVKSNHIYISGNRIRKTGEQTYKADRVTITSCDGDSPDWKITGRNLKVTIEGYGTVFHSAFWTKKVPVAYSPFLAFPVKLKRQTGLLQPSITFNSKRKGFEYFQPLFWAINKHADATFYLRHMEKRGNQTGFEFRYEPKRSISGTIMYDYLHDKEIDDGTPEATEKWGYPNGGTRFNRKRYWFRMKHAQKTFANTSLKLNADVVSDQDYLREFFDMENGFEETKEYFKKRFGSAIDTEGASIRTNSILLNKTWPLYSLGASFYWYDNIPARISNSPDYTLQRLPQINFAASRQKVLNSPFYFSLDSEFTSFYRKETSESNYKGLRSDIKPGLFLPLKFFRCISIEPSVSLRDTGWYVQSDLGPETSTDPSTGATTSLISEKGKRLPGSHNRFIYETSVEASTDIYRVFRVNFGKTDRIKHSLTTRLSHGFIPEKDQSDLPYFDGADRVAKKNILKFSITNYLTGRRLAGDKSLNRKAEKNYLYNNFCRFHLSQSYDINEKRAERTEEFRNGNTREEYLPLLAEFDLTPVNYFKLDTDFQWSKYIRGIIKSSINLSVYNRRGDSIAAEYSYTRDSVESIMAQMDLKLTGGISIYGSDEYNIALTEHIERKAGLKYRSQCWGIDLLYTDTADERKYTLKINLMSLGGLGAKTKAQDIENYF